MSDPNDMFFKNLQAPAFSRNMPTTGFEETVIKQLFRATGFQPHWGALARECAAVTGSHALTFRWFHETYPGFPLTLGASPVAWVHKITMRDIFESFLKSVLFKAYMEFVHAAAIDDRQTSVAFVFREVRRYMVLHNFPRNGEMGDEAAEHMQGTRIVHQLGQVVYVVEPLPKLLAAIGSHWLPSE